VASKLKEAEAGEQLSFSLVTSPTKLRLLTFSSHSIVISFGAVKVGLVLSSTVIVCVSELEFPHSSVAVQVLTIVFVFPQVAVSTSLSVIVTLPQVSDPVATPVFAEDVSSVHSIVVSAGALIVGGVVSTTLIVCVPVVMLPHLSVAVKVLRITLVFPQPGTLVSSLSS